MPTQGTFAAPEATKGVDKGACFSGRRAKDPAVGLNNCNTEPDLHGDNFKNREADEKEEDNQKDFKDFSGVRDRAFIRDR